MDSLDTIKWIRRAQMDIESASREAAIFRPPMKQALQDASQIFDFTKSKLRELGYEYLPEQDDRQTPP